MTEPATFDTSDLGRHVEALDRAVRVTLALRSEDTAEDIVARARTFDTFLAGGNPRASDAPEDVAQEIRYALDGILGGELPEILAAHYLAEIGESHVEIGGQRMTDAQYRAATDPFRRPTDVAVYPKTNDAWRRYQETHLGPDAMEPRAVFIGGWVAREDAAVAASGA
jgi:hypothetical protein